MSEQRLAAVSASRENSLANLRRFRPGASGNPSGRPKGQAGFAAYVRRQTREGREVAAFVLGLLRDEDADPRLRLEAATWLANRAFGIPVQSHELTGEGGGAVTFTLRLGEREDDG